MIFVRIIGILLEYTLLESFFYFMLGFLPSFFFSDPLKTTLAIIGEDLYCFILFSPVIPRCLALLLDYPKDASV